MHELSIQVELPNGQTYHFEQKFVKWKRTFIQFKLVDEFWTSWYDGQRAPLAEKQKVCQIEPLQEGSNLSKTCHIDW